jgi:hypothetical protein
MIRTLFFVEALSSDVLRRGQGRYGRVAEPDKPSSDELANS